MKKILVIEDNMEVRDNIEETLELSGYEVVTAEDGNIGVQLALENPPDLIVCDVMMPKLDGFGVLNILSKKPKTANIPFIFLTAKTEKTDFRRGMNLGADDYLTKPFYKDELLQVIETRLKKKEQLQQKFDKTSDTWKVFINEAKGLEALKKLSQSHDTQVFRKKELLFEEGSHPRYLYFIQHGRIKIYNTSEYGKEYIINVRNAGDFIGYTALIKESKYHFAAAALEETKVSLIPKADFQKLLYANQYIASRFIKILANNVANKETQLLNLAYHSVRKRVAEALLLLCKNQLKKPLEVHILREDLARIVGTAKESVIRVLTEFKEDGLIKTQNNSIVILKKKQLEDLPN